MITTTLGPGFPGPAFLGRARVGTHTLHNIIIPRHTLAGRTRDGPRRSRGLFNPHCSCQDDRPSFDSIRRGPATGANRTYLAVRTSCARVACIAPCALAAACVPCPIGFRIFPAAALESQPAEGHNPLHLRRSPSKPPNAGVPRSSRAGLRCLITPSGSKPGPGPLWPSMSSGDG